MLQTGQMLQETPNGIVVGHADHGLKEVHFELIDNAMHDWKGEFRIMTVGIPEGIDKVPSAIYGPSAGDEPVQENEVFYERRGNRYGPSRLIKAPYRMIDTIIVIAGPGAEGESLIYTAYGGPSPAPHEWWDKNLKPREAMKAATFWSVHALATGEDGSEDTGEE